MVPPHSLGAAWKSATFARENPSAWKLEQKPLSVTRIRFDDATCAYRPSSAATGKDAEYEDLGNGVAHGIHAKFQTRKCP
jgi:hypothetical protein